MTLEADMIQFLKTKTQNQKQPPSPLPPPTRRRRSYAAPRCARTSKRRAPPHLACITPGLHGNTAPILSVLQNKRTKPETPNSPPSFPMVPHVPRNTQVRTHQQAPCTTTAALARHQFCPSSKTNAQIQKLQTAPSSPIAPHVPRSTQVRTHQQALCITTPCCRPCTAPDCPISRSAVFQTKLSDFPRILLQGSRGLWHLHISTAQLTCTAPRPAHRHLPAASSPFPSTFSNPIR
jgi:hypothetical protein